MSLRDKTAAARYDKWYAHGYRSYRPASEALAFYREIKERTGMTDREIAVAAGFSHTRGIAKLKAGEHRRVQGDTYRRLLALRNSIPTPLRVPAVGAQRRLEGLHRMGWTRAIIRERLGFSTDWLRSRSPTYLIPVEVHQKIVALYDELSMIPGPSRRAGGYAQKAGKAPPLAWDDDTIDDPNAKPNVTGGHHRVPGYIDHAKLARRLAGDRSIHLSKYEAAEAARILQSRGVSGNKAHEVYGLNPDRYGWSE